MGELTKAIEIQDFLKLLEILLKDLFKENIIDGAVLFSGDPLSTYIITDEKRITGKTLDDIEGVAKSFVEKAVKEGKEILEDDLIVRRGSQSSIYYRIKSIYVCPVFRDEKLAGILYIDRIRSENKFSQAERLWLRFLGKIFQLYLEASFNKKLIEDLQKEIWIGKSDASEKIRMEIKKLCNLSPILILGETGTGKGLTAELIHKLSGRRGKFVVVSLPSFPETLFEAELFGCKKGAYTGAEERLGLVGEADKGSLFFDEISEIPLSVQAKLLRFMDVGLYKRLGEDKERKADCKVICASNKDLNSEIERGLFRKDLFFRISTYTIKIPPLRERVEDIEEIARVFLRRYGFSVSDEAMRILRSYDFPGNVRELQNILSRIIVEVEGSVVDESHVKCFLSTKEINRLEMIIKRIEEGETFWEAVKKPFLDKELNRNEVKEIIRMGMKKTDKGTYKELTEFFNLKEREYHKFMAFLHKYRLIEKKKGNKVDK